MRRSRVDTAETRKRIVATASKMFLANGIESVGMRDIMAAAQLTPSALYRHFKSKQELVAETNNAAFDRLLTMFELRTIGKSPADALETIASIYLTQCQVGETDYFCPLAMIGAELSHGEPAVRETAMSGYKRLVECVANRLTHLDKPAALATAGGIISTLVGAVTLANLAPDRLTAASILNDGHALIRLLVEREIVQRGPSSSH